MTLTQFSHPDPALISALSSGGFDRNPSRSEGLDPKLSHLARLAGYPRSFLRSEKFLATRHLVMLYWTLVADGRVPPGYESDFVDLGPGIKQAADRTNRRFSREDNMSAAVAPQEQRVRRQEDEVDKPGGGSIHARVPRSYGPLQVQTATTVLRRPSSKARRRGKPSQEDGLAFWKDSREGQRHPWVNVWSAVHQVLFRWVQVAEHPPSGRE